MTKKELRRDSDARERILNDIVATRNRSKALANRSQIRAYLRNYFVDVPIEDLMGRAEGTMARIALDHLEFGATRKQGQALLRIFNPSERQHGYTSNFTFIELVNDDMPFLVDSVSAAISRQNLSAHITVHPVYCVKRDERGRLQSITQRGKNCK